MPPFESFRDAPAYYATLGQIEFTGRRAAALNRISAVTTRIAAIARARN